MTDGQRDGAVTTDRDNPGRDNTPRTGRTLAEAARELQGLLRAQRAREHAGREARVLEQLERQSARRRAAVAAAEEPGGER